MKKDNKISSFSLIVLSLVAIFYVIYIGASLIIPFVIAFLLSFAISSLSKFFNRKGLNKILSFLLSILTFILLFWAVGELINSNIEEISKQSTEYQEKFKNIIKQVDNNLKEKNIKISDFISYNDITDKINIPGLVAGFASSITAVFKSTGIVIFYVIFILLEGRFFLGKMNLIFSKERSKDRIFDIIKLIEKDVKAYFFIKTIVSLITASVSYIIMSIFGLDFALFWAFLIFLLNYIPTIGSMVAVFFPVIFSLIQFESFRILFGMLICLAGIQIIMGNIIEPRFMGNKLNLSPLVILISLLFWGSLWGIAGMLLSVPIMVIINIILSHIQETKPIAIMLSEKGIIKTDFGNIERKKKVLTKIKEKIFRK